MYVKLREIWASLSLSEGFGISIFHHPTANVHFQGSNKAIFARMLSTFQVSNLLEQVNSQLVSRPDPTGNWWEATIENYGRRRRF